jgi:hypothetical protein
MKITGSGIFFLLASIVLVFLLGWKFGPRIMEGQKREVSTFAIVERPIFLPATHDTVQSEPIAGDSSAQAEIIRLIASSAQKDSDMSVLKSKLEPHSVTDPDSISYSDSLGAFYTLMEHFIHYDPMLERFTRSTIYHDSRISSTVRTNTFYVPDSWITRILYGSAIGAIFICIYAIFHH